MFPLVGGAISDSYLGKYYTILIFTLLGLVGNILFVFFSIDGVVSEFGNYPIWAFLLPVVIMSVGLGMAKPCVGSHAGDQFDDKDSLDKFFSLLTVVTYTGILLAVVSVPYIKNELGYPVAYATTTSVLLLSLILFVSGKGAYKVIAPQGEFLTWKIAKIIVLASVRKLKRYHADNWLELAQDKYSNELIQEAHHVLRVITMFSPLVFAWMLQEQISTEWQNQYEMMDKSLFGITLPTEGCSAYGVLLAIMFAPTVGFIVFPFLERREIKISAGMRIAMGYFLVVISFVISTSLQYWVVSYAGNQVLTNKVAISCDGCMHSAWQLPQWVFFSLGDAILIPSAAHLAYSNVGPKMKASSLSIVYLSIAIGNYTIIVMEQILAFTSDGILRQWCYVAISFFFLIVYLLLLKLWFIPNSPPSKSLAYKSGKMWDA
ncbi:hypothetical protein DSO57_1020744 [Entomophthora muscae]|uniref:Uncharacterized protein n=1 Tax=Entomophthora muscae TaxID=34485 RepID=A0ACC2RI76_9FUNG|nr:hypothetical protein DSO57_1020744 [Entomophthora muscae]